MTHVVAVATPPRETLLGATAASVVKGTAVPGFGGIVGAGGVVVGGVVGGGRRSGRAATMPASHPLSFAGGAGPVSQPATSTIRWVAPNV